MESTLDESIFAANLGTVLQGTAPPVYGDPAEFFSRTHPSSGLKALLNLCLGRLAGAVPDAPPIIRIATNLGGGKTHNLIALSHAVQGGLDAASAERLLSSPVGHTLGQMPGVRLAAFVGTDHGVSASENTMWGLLANQLGGASGYALVRPDDVGRTAPGTATLAELLGNEPNLIVVDEIAQYLQKADGVEVGNGTLADQTLTFLMALCEAAARVPRTVLVLTTTQDSSVFSSGTEKVVALMTRVREITGRQAHLIQPSAEEDLPSILSRRLFAHVDRSNIADIAASYADALTAAEQRWENGLPAELAPVRLASRMHETWPFHPELIVLLDKRLSTNPYFQRTRGALRLLARTIQLLWQSGAESASAIHPHHLNLADGTIIRPQLTQALQQPQMDAVARADVANENEHEPSRADLIDQRYDASCIRHAATTCFVHSLHLGAAMTQGHTLATTLEPDTDPDILLDGWTRLVREAWYLHQDSEGFRFKTEPSLTKMVVDRTNTESSRAASAAVVLKKALPGAVSQLLVLSVVAVVGLTVWGGWYAWDAYQYWNRHVRNHPVTWQDGRLFTDLTLWDYLLAADDAAQYRLLHLKFLMHFGYETGAMPHPESTRAFRQSLKYATAPTPDGADGLLWLMNAMAARLDAHAPHEGNLHDENLCIWMYDAFVTVQRQHRGVFLNVYDPWLVSDAAVHPNTICHLPTCRNETGPCQLN